MRAASAKSNGVFRALCLLSLSLSAAGCGKRQPPAPAADPATDAAPAAPIKTAEEYVLTRIVDSGVQGLKGIALDARDNLYAAGAGGVKVWSADGRLLREWQTSGPRKTCIALDAEGNVYLGLQHKVEVFDPEGKPLRSWGKEGRGPGELNYVTAIAAFKTNILVADAGNRCVHRFDLTGDFIDDIGKRDPQAGLPGLVCPSPHLDVAVDKAGILHITNPGLTRVELYDLNGKELGFWGEGGTQPQQFSGCCNPTNIALAQDGRVVTSEKLPARVKVYDATGSVLAHLGPQHFTKDAAGLGLAVDSTGRVWVMDPGDGKIRVFERKK